MPNIGAFTLPPTRPDYHGALTYWGRCEDACGCLRARDAEWIRRHTTAADGLFASAAVFASHALGATATETGTRSVSAVATADFTPATRRSGSSRTQRRAESSSIECTAATGKIPSTAWTIRAWTST